jgi:hypothetical protein
MKREYVHLDDWLSYEFPTGPTFTPRYFVGKVIQHPDDLDDEFDEPMVTLLAPFKQEFPSGHRYDTYTVRVSTCMPAQDPDLWQVEHAISDGIRNLEEQLHDLRAWESSLEDWDRRLTAMSDAEFDELQAND